MSGIDSCYHEQSDFLDNYHYGTEDADKITGMGRPKGLLQYIDDICERFTYEDFQPPVKPIYILYRTGVVLLKRTPYWTQEWTGSNSRVILRLKEFEPHDHIVKKLNIYVTEKHFIFEPNKVNRSERSTERLLPDWEVFFSDIHLDHRVLSNKLKEVFSAMIAKSIED